MLGGVREQGLAERDQTLDGGRTRPERGRPADEAVLELARGRVEHGEHQRAAVAEAPEQRSLADTRLGRDRIHRCT